MPVTRTESAHAGPSPSSFRTRLLILLCLGVLPSLALVLYLNFEQRHLETTRVREEAVATSRLSAANQQNYFAHTRQLLATLTQFQFLTLNTNRAYVQENLSNLRKLSPNYLNFGLIETNGILFASSEIYREPVDLSDRTYFRRVLETKKFSAGDFQVGRLTSEPALNFGFPVLDDEGRLNRVLYASLRLGLLSERLSQIPLDREASITVLDRNGSVLACVPHPELPVGTKWPNRAALERILELKQGVFEIKGTDGITRLHAVTPVYDSESASLFVSVDIPLKVCYERANHNLARNFAFLVVLAIAIMAGGRYYAKRFFLKPVTELARAAAELASGDLNARVGPISGASELSRLGRAFDEMAVSLQQRQIEVEKAHEEIRQMNEQLEQRVKDRTAALEAANQELEAFSYSVSHDLRAPLRHVSGFVDLLQRKGSSLDPDTMRLVDFIGTAAKQMNHLVDDLLRLSRMTRAEIRLTEVDLSSLVDEVRAGFDGELDGRAVEWRVDPLPHVKADPALLRVVLTNLIGNAIKYTRPRNPAVIEIGSQPDGAQQVIYVRDNGVGFDMEYATKLFGVFQRFHHAEEFEGTGIGLATVQRIITRLGGRVWAQAKENEGATFYFSLPASPPPHQSPNHP